ncbi:MAG: hypothetical protein ACJ741_20460 [Pyrinomonadaceae bacterium]
MFRALVLSLIILVTVATMLPVGETLVEAARRAVATQGSSPRRHSRAWWRRHRAHLRRQRALAAQRRRRRWTLRRRAQAAQTHPAGITLPEALKPAEIASASPSSFSSIADIEAEVAATPQLLDAPQFAPLQQLSAAQLSTPAPTQIARVSTANTPTPQLAHAPQRVSPKANAPRSEASNNAIASQPFVPSFNPSPLPSLLARVPGAAPLVKSSVGLTALAGARKFSPLPAPRNWQNLSSTLGGEFKFSLREADNRPAGVAVWSRVSLAANAVADRRNRSLAGVSHASLRRTVIDRMIVEGGWVVNDFERDIAGQKVFVVVAQSEGTGGARRFWTYYFVEVEGQLFSLATTVPNEFADAVAGEAEQTIAALAARRHAAAQN